MFRMAVDEFEEQITVLCLYKSIPADLEDRILELNVQLHQGSMLRLGSYNNKLVECISRPKRFL